MLDVVVSARVKPEQKARLIELAGANGKNTNQVLSELINDYISNHDKLNHPERTEPKPELLKIDLEPPESEAEINPDEFVEEMWDTFVSYARDRGYRLIKTKTLRKLLDVIKLRKGAKKEPYVCPKCEYKADEKFGKCPKCGVKLSWD